MDSNGIHPSDASCNIDFQLFQLRLSMLLMKQIHFKKLSSCLFLHETLAELASVNERQIRCSEHVFTDESVTVLRLFMNIQEIFIGSMFHAPGP